MANIRYTKADVDGCGVFYREAGNPAESKLLLWMAFRLRGICSAI